MKQLPKYSKTEIITTEKPNTLTELRYPSYPVRICFIYVMKFSLGLNFKIFSHLLLGVRSPVKYKNERKSDSDGDVECYHILLLLNFYYFLVKKSTFIFYNRVNKCGSTSMLELIGDLGKVKLAYQERMNFYCKYFDRIEIKISHNNVLIQSVLKDFPIISR